MTTVDIVQLTPGTNCRDCGFEGCVEYAENVQNCKASLRQLSRCPYLSVTGYSIDKQKNHYGVPFRGNSGRAVIESIDGTESLPMQPGEKSLIANLIATLIQRRHDLLLRESIKKYGSP